MGPRRLIVYAAPVEERMLAHTISELNRFVIEKRPDADEQPSQ
jgi:hypothetical protein